MSIDVGVIMGSKSDWSTMKECCDILENLGIVMSVMLFQLIELLTKCSIMLRAAKSRGLKVIIAGAGGAAHLPGMVAAKTDLPVLGVPVKSSTLSGKDSLLSIVQMPAGIPVATFAIGVAGAKNAALFAASILQLVDSKLVKH
ncbi:5-(carboxyamino)imidazole ribonucleotide mutase [Francisella noatunensis]